MKLDVLLATTRSETGWAKRLSDSAFLVGAGLLIWSAYIHFDLWQNFGYRHIPAIGPLFLMQAIVALLIGLGALAIRSVLVALLGAAFALATLVGFLITVEHGLFGFRDSWSAPFAAHAFGLEIAAIAVLLFAAVLCGAQFARPERADSAQTEVSPTRV